MLFEALVASARANQLAELCFVVQPFNEAVRRILDGVDVGLTESGGLVQGRIEVSSVPPTDRDERFVELLVEARARH